MRKRRDAQDDVTACLALLEQRSPRPLTLLDMARMLGLDHYDRKAIGAALDAAVAADRLRRIGKTRYQWPREAAGGGRARTDRPAPRPRSASALEGRYSRVRAGYGFVELLGRAAARFPRDILVPAGMEGGALHGDGVRLEITRRDPRSQRSVGRVVAVTQSAHEDVIGTLERHGRRWFAIPFDERLPAVALIDATPPADDAAGLVARVHLIRSAAATREGLRGTLDAVLGAADDPEVQFLAIAGEHGLRLQFSPASHAEADALPTDPVETDFAGRDDLRQLPFVTIDGETARDFDDAVCLAARPDGGACLWVAIADVAHYVRPGSALDAEAASRGTSVYFPDRAIPMLPERLSNHLCSLKPDCDRLVLVAELHYDRAGRRGAVRCRRGVIRSRARLTYTQVAAVLSDTDTAEIRAWRDQLGGLVPQLQHMGALMHTLYAQRLRAGSLDLDLPEALVDLSESGRTAGLRVAARNDAHRLIEEFMLEANRAVAAWLRDEALPIPYRVHEPPAPDDIDELNQLLGVFGLHVDYDGVVQPADVQRLLDQLEGHRLGRVLSRQVLRALRQAQYSTRNVGHFGLAFPIYCHFTSPIRRYPDLLVHRQIGRLLDGAAELARSQAEVIEAACVASSQAERAAMEAERAMLDLRKADFMLAHLLEPEPGTVVSVISAGLFIELDAYPVEGLLRADDLHDDRYYYVEAERALKGARTRQRYRLGDRVVVEATNVALQRRQIDFGLVRRIADDAAAESAATPRRPRPRKGGAGKVRPQTSKAPRVSTRKDSARKGARTPTKRRK